MSAAQPDALRFALLGPVRAWHGATVLDVGTPQQQAVLAMLLLRAGRPVDLDELVDGVWGERPPRAAVGTVRTYASRLRTRLSASSDEPALVSVGRGYALTVPPDAVDVHRFEVLASHAAGARSSGDPARAASLLHDALGLFEGRPLSGVPGPHADAVRDRLVERRLQVVRDRLATDLDLGHHHGLVGELTELCREHPLREELRALLMLALYRSGRAAEALGVYADTARVLAAEYGTDPGPELSALHRRILTTDDTLAAPPARPGVTPGPPAGPAQLPAGTADFTGRSGAVAELTAALAASDGSALVVSSVAGIGGVGKTTLAVHVAHRAADRFPDGQLFVNLRGGRPDPADPGAVLAGFLRAFGVTDTAIPDGLDERAALYRSVLSGRRVLVLLDDARDVAQVRPLLPGSPTCAVIVTSRSRLAALPAARRVDLDVLEPDEALMLLGSIVGRARVSAESGPALALVGACGFLPLAVRIVGARLASRSGWTVESMALRLAVERDRLVELRVDDLDVETSFRLGYDQLDAATARAFRLLAVPDVADVTVPMAAAALDVPVPRVGDLLEKLVDLAMLESTGADRYRFHDLLRLFARAESERTDTDDDRSDVLVRLLDFHLATARNAYRVVRPGHAVPDTLAATRSPGRRIVTRDDALDWAGVELGAVLAVVEQAMATGGPPPVGPAVTLAADVLLALDPLLEFGFLWGQSVEPARAVLARARAADDPVAEGRAGYLLSGALMQLGSVAEAEAIASRAWEAAGRAGDTAVRAEVGTVLGIVLGLVVRNRADWPLAMRYFTEAAELAGSCGSRWGQANTLLNLAATQLDADHVADALAACERSIGLFQPLGDPFGEAYGLCMRARVHRRLGDLDASMAAYRTVLPIAVRARLAMFEVLSGVELSEVLLDAGRWAEALSTAECGRAAARRVSWERREAQALAVLGRALAGLGEPERSQACLREAHRIYTRLELPTAAELSRLFNTVS